MADEHHDDEITIHNTQVERPKIPVPTFPLPQTSSSSGILPVSPIRDLNTTAPPGSPVKDTPPAPLQMSVPALPASPLSISLVGPLPRSNNHCIRSSPFVNIPLVLKGDVEKLPPVSSSVSPVMVAQPAAPNAPSGKWTPPTPEQPTEDDSPSLNILVPHSSRETSGIFAPITVPASAPSLFVSAKRAATTTIAPTTSPDPSGSLFTLTTSLPVFTPSTASQVL